MENPDLIKIVVSGPTNSGKSSIIERYLKGNFDPSYKYTVGVDFRYKLIRDEKRRPIKIHIWDTCGLKHFRDLIKLYNHDAHVIVYTFDINDESSLKECMEIINQSELRPDIKLYLVGNKSDLLSHDYENKEVDDICANQNIEFIRCSAKSGENIDSLFERIVANHKYKLNNINIDIGDNTKGTSTIFNYLKC